MAKPAGIAQEEEIQCRPIASKEGYRDDEGMATVLPGTNMNAL